MPRPPESTTRTVAQQVGYAVIRLLARLFGVGLFRLRCFGRQHVPKTGAVLVCSNHQSFFDPILVGLTCDRRLNSLARESLFRVPVLRWWIQFLDAIPIDRDGLGMAGLRESLRRLRRGEMVLIFPEGTRSVDGSVAELQSGFCLLARRGEVTLLPVGIDGAYDAWPRTAICPRLATIRICVGEPIRPEHTREISNEQLVSELQVRIRDCHARARKSRLG